MKDLSVKLRNIQESYARGMKALKEVAKKEVINALKNKRAVKISTPLACSDCMDVKVWADPERGLVVVEYDNAYSNDIQIEWDNLEEKDWINIYWRLSEKY